MEIIFKAFDNESFSHQGKHYVLLPEVGGCGYRPNNGPVQSVSTTVTIPANDPIEAARVIRS